MQNLPYRARGVCRRDLLRVAAGGGLSLGLAALVSADHQTQASRILVDGLWKDSCDGRGGLYAIDPTSGDFSVIARQGTSVRPNPRKDQLALVVDGRLGCLETLAGGDGRPKRLSSLSGMPVWSADGDEIYLSEVRYEPLADGRSAHQRQCRSWAVRVRDGRRRRLPLPSTYLVLDGSPSGELLLSVAETGADVRQNALMLCHPDGSRRRTLCEPDTFVDGRFSPDGTRVALIRSMSDAAQIILRDTWENRTRCVFETSGAGILGVSWSPCGRQLAAVAYRWESTESADDAVGRIPDRDSYRLLTLHVDSGRIRVVPCPPARWLGSPSWV